MTNKRNIELNLLCSYLVISLGGFMLHARIHDPAKDAENYIPFIAGLISIFVLTTLFSIRKTVPYAYLLNGVIVIIGTITMAHFSYEKLMTPPPPPALAPPLTVYAIFMGTLLMDILILTGKFFIGKALFVLALTPTDKLEAPVVTGRFWRYPKNGFWLVHFIAISALYLIGYSLSH